MSDHADDNNDTFDPLEFAGMVLAFVGREFIHFLGERFIGEIKAYVDPTYGKEIEK